MTADADAPAWLPDDRVRSRSHIGRLMADRGAADVADLHAWTMRDPDTFWSLVVRELDVVFDVAPAATVDLSDPRHPVWFPGAEMNIVRTCLDGDDDRLAILAAGHEATDRVTLGALRTAVAGFAAGFAEAGYEPGDRIAIAMPMTVEAVVAYLGIIAAGGVVVSIADSFAVDEIAIRLDITEPVAVVTQDVIHRSGKRLPMYEKCVAASAIPCIVVETGADVELRPSDVSWSSFQRSASFDPVPRSPSDHTNILFSSGTTGEPKAIPWSHSTPLKAAMDGRFHHDIHAGDVVAWPTNLGWMMGPWLIYASLLNGAAMALYTDAPTTRRFVDFVEEACVTMLGLVPSIVSAWRAGDVLREGDLPSLRVLSSTGEASNPSDYRWLMETVGVPVIEYCGGTEVGGGYITGTVVEPAIPSRFTTPALGLDIALLDEVGDPTDSGECFLVGASIGLSTELLNRDHDAVYFDGTPHGLRRHGDHLERLADGTWRARGRVDDTMNLGGIKTSSAELEEVLGDVPGVRDVAAVAVPPPEGGPEQLVVFVVLDDGTEAGGDLLATMQLALRDHVNPLFRIGDLVAVDALPRTASQKVMRRVLRAEYGA